MKTILGGHSCLVRLVLTQRCIYLLQLLLSSDNLVGQVVLEEVNVGDSAHDVRPKSLNISFSILRDNVRPFLKVMHDLLISLDEASTLRWFSRAHE